MKPTPARTPRPRSVPEAYRRVVPGFAVWVLIGSSLRQGATRWGSTVLPILRVVRCLVGRIVAPWRVSPVVIDAAARVSPVTVYWRPGFPYCHRLRTDLARIGLPVREVNIWRNVAAAARVRSLAGGNETVPTVTVAERALVNPSAGQVLDAVGQVAPELVPVCARRTVARSRWLRLGQWVVLIGLLVAGVGAEVRGAIGLSRWLDGAAMLALVVGWVLRTGGLRLAGAAGSRRRR